MNNNFFKHIKSQSINMSSALETVKKEASNGKIDFLMKLSKDTHLNNDFSKLASSAAIVLAEKGHMNALRQLDKLQPISNETRIECMKASLRTGHPDTAIFIKSLVFNSKDKNKDRPNSISARKNEKSEKLSIQEQKKILMDKIKNPNTDTKPFTEPGDVKIVIHKDVKPDKGQKIYSHSEKRHEKVTERTRDSGISSINGRNVVISSGNINGKIVQNGVEREAGDFKDKDGSVIHVSKFDTLEGFSFFGSGNQSKPSFDDFIKNVVNEYEREQNDSQEPNGILVNHGTIDHGITMKDGVIIDSDEDSR